MKNVSGNPFIIQFSDLDDFITEVTLTGIDVARVWLGQYSTGGSPGVRYHTVMVQAIDPAQHAILMTSLVIGSYQTLYGKPFGPTEEDCAFIVKNANEGALADVQSYLVSKLPDIVLRSGNIFTGLDGLTIGKAYWSGFNAIYDALKKARGG